MTLDPWQRDALTLSLMERGAERWAAREVGLIVGRQNGKGVVLEARQIVGLFLLRERLSIHTAHEFKTCYEHFRRVVDIVENCSALSKMVKMVRTGAGDQAIELKNGCRLRFLARSRSSGRGFSGDTIYLDEAFLLSDSAMGALLPALSARPNPQLWLSSSAPHADSEVLHRVRARGHAGDDARLLFMEWGNEADVDPTDRAAWRRANPGLGIRITEDSIESERRAMAPDEFARERLGVPEAPEDTRTIIPAELWDGLAVPLSQIVTNVALALDVSPDRKWASFGVAGRAGDGVAQVELVDRRPGSSWVVARAAQLAADHKAPIRVEKGGPAGSLLSQLDEAGVPVIEVATADLTRATGQFIDWALAGDLRHLGGDVLKQALMGASLRASGDAELWSRRSSRVDITPLVAVTLALGGVPEPVGPAPVVPMAAFV